jgi:lipopolysaccharide/colanic/teichoic acid biosynthesis glycosyltransferase
MSLVGPRPEVPRYVALYPPDVRDIVLSVKPGITDRASVEFRDESALLASAEDPHTEYIQRILATKTSYYVRYARTHTLLGDVRILAATMIAIFRRPKPNPR